MELLLKAKANVEAADEDGGDLSLEEDKLHHWETVNVNDGR